MWFIQKLAKAFLKKTLIIVGGNRNTLVKTTSFPGLPLEISQTLRENPGNEFVIKTS